MRSVKFLIILALLLCIGHAYANKYAQVYGPSLSSNMSIPNTHTIFAVYSVPDLTGGGITFRNIDTGEMMFIGGSVTYTNMLFYGIPKGDYEVVEIPSGYDVCVNLTYVKVGSVVSLRTGGSIIFYCLY